MQTPKSYNPASGNRLRGFLQTFENTGGRCPIYESLWRCNIREKSLYFDELQNLSWRRRWSRRSNSSMQRIHTSSRKFRSQNQCNHLRTNHNWTSSSSSYFTISWHPWNWNSDSIHDNAKSDLLGADIPREEPLREWLTSQRSKRQSHEFWNIFGKTYCKRKRTLFCRDGAIPHRGNSCDAVWNSDESSVQLFRRRYSFWRQEVEWPSCLETFWIHSFEAEVVRHNDQDERETDGAVHWNRWFKNCGEHFRSPEGENSRTQIGINTFMKEATRRGSSIAWIPEISYLYIRVIHGRTGNMIALELMGHVAIPYKWKEFLFHRGCSFDVTSIRRSGLLAGGRESKEGRQTIIFTPLNPFGDNPDEEEPRNDLSKPRKVHYHSEWKKSQNAFF